VKVGLLSKRFQTWNIILLLVFALLAFAVVYPLLYIFKASFVEAETGAFSLKSYGTFFHYPFYLRCLKNSLFVSTLATLFSLILGIPFAFFLSRYRVPGKSLLKTLGTLPLILPTFIGAEAWLLLMGRNGMFARIFQQIGVEAPSIYGWKGIVLVFTLQFFPFVFLMVSAAINAIDRSLEEAATNLGAGRPRVFFTVTLPLISPAILSGALVVFYLCIENFGVPTLIGEDFRVLSVQAYNEFISEMGGESIHGRRAQHGPARHHLGPHGFPELLDRTQELRHDLPQPSGGQDPPAVGNVPDLVFLRGAGICGSFPFCSGHNILGDPDIGAGHVFRPVQP
jgi:iron(III) transport system permease protein